MKKIISVTVCIVLLISMLSVVCFADDAAYWKAQKAYADANASGNKDSIVAAVKMIEAAYPNPSNADQYNRTATPIFNAAKIYEEQTKYDLAIQYYQKALKYYTWLDKNTSANYKDLMINIPETILHLSVKPEVYTATSNLSTLPYYGARNESKAGTYFGTCNTFDAGESAFLLYVRFGSEKISDFGYRIHDTSQDYILEVAWNAYPENKSFFDGINSGKWDSYINEQLSYLGTLSGKIMLRFAAEMNCWPENTNNGAANAKAFKDAYIRIAKKARTLCPKVALVFSPNDVSNRNVKVSDFYPGDAYVDWVGMSSYRNISATAEAHGKASGNDAYFCRGDYENQILQVHSVVELAEQHKKPVMISECGFCYKAPDGKQTEAHAVKALKEFYTWINRVYPSVKLVLYFDTNNGSSNQYLLSGNAKVNAAYNSMVAANAAMQSTLPGKTPTGYVKADNFNEKRNSMEFSVYAYYPAHEAMTVTMYVDGVKKVSSSTAPYSTTVNTAAWSTGVHTVRVCAKSGRTSRSVIKVLSKDASGVITCVGSLRDVADSHWANSFIDTCLQQGVFKGTSFTAFEPESVMTRAMFVQVLANISGADLSSYTTSAFSDVRSKDWFCKAVMWANKLGVVNGVAPGKFDPNGSITREQMCVMLQRYATKQGIHMPTGGKVTTFEDQAKIGSWAKDAVVACQKAGLIGGETRGGKTYFDPANGATRAQACKIFSIFNQF